MTHSGSRKKPVATLWHKVGGFYRVMAAVLLGAMVIALVRVCGAHAATTGDVPVAASMPHAASSVMTPDAAQKKPAQNPAQDNAVVLRGACTDGMAVFTVTNNTQDWTGRGYLRIMDIQTGHMLRERWMRFKEGQSASFIIKPELAPSGRYRISVTLPDRTMTYKKSFRGHCPPPGADVRNASR